MPNHSNRLVAKEVEMPCIGSVIKGRRVSQSYYGIISVMPEGDEVQQASNAVSVADQNNGPQNRPKRVPLMNVWQPN